jgi:hypothetical protein
MRIAPDVEDMSLKLLKHLQSILIGTGTFTGAVAGSARTLPAAENAVDHTASGEVDANAGGTKETGLELWYSLVKEGKDIEKITHNIILWGGDGLERNGAYDRSLSRTTVKLSLGGGAWEGILRLDLTIFFDTMTITIVFTKEVEIGGGVAVLGAKSKASAGMRLLAGSPVILVISNLGVLVFAFFIRSVLDDGGRTLFFGTDRWCRLDRSEARSSHHLH